MAQKRNGPSLKKVLAALSVLFYVGVVTATIVAKKYNVDSTWLHPQNELESFCPPLSQHAHFGKGGSDKDHRVSVLQLELSKAQGEITLRQKQEHDLLWWRLSALGAILAWLLIFHRESTPTPDPAAAPGRASFKRVSAFLGAARTPGGLLALQAALIFLLLMDVRYTWLQASTMDIGRWILCTEQSIGLHGPSYANKVGRMRVSTTAKKLRSVVREKLATSAPYGTVQEALSAALKKDRDIVRRLAYAALGTFPDTSVLSRVPPSGKDAGTDKAKAKTNATWKRFLFKVEDRLRLNSPGQRSWPIPISPAQRPRAAEQATQALIDELAALIHHPAGFESWIHRDSEHNRFPRVKLVNSPLGIALTMLPILATLALLLIAGRAVDHVNETKPGWIVTRYGVYRVALILRTIAGLCLGALFSVCWLSLTGYPMRSVYILAHLAVIGAGWLLVHCIMDLPRRDDAHHWEVAVEKVLLRSEREVLAAEAGLDDALEQSGTCQAKKCLAVANYQKGLRRERDYLREIADIPLPPSSASRSTQKRTNRQIEAIEKRLNIQKETS